MGVPNSVLTNSLESAREGAHSRRPQATVVIATHNGAETIGATLESLANQSLADAHYEVVVVHNGPRDSTEDIVRETQRRHSSVAIRYLYTSTGGAGRARNLGINAARGEYVTFVDDDDAVSPSYLEALLGVSRSTRIGLALMADVKEDGVPDFSSPARRRQIDRAGDVFPAHEYVVGLTFTAAKMVPTALARTVGFNENLRSGEDMVFYASLYSRAPMRFATVQLEDNAVYYRTVRQGSMTRGAVTWDFNVVQRLDVIQALEAIPRTNAGIRTVVRQLIDGQTGFINTFLRVNPDRRDDVLAEVDSRRIKELPYSRLNAGLARDLAILYTALPYRDTSAIVAARRLRQRHNVIDVLSCNLHPLRSLEPVNERTWADILDQHYVTPTTPSWSGVGHISNYCVLGLEKINEWMAEKGPYRTVYSRVMWPGAHILAALFKLQNPDVEWTAEFSDPALHDIQSAERKTKGTFDAAIMRQLRAGMRAAGYEPPKDNNLWLWIEILPYALADRILFTNPNQRDYMLSYCADRGLAERALAHSEVSPHPTLPPEFYEVMHPEYEVDPDRVHLAYFGAFYLTRGLTEVVGGLLSMEPAKRARVQLHVFTQQPEKLADEAREAGLEDVIIANPYVGYLECLNLCTRFDVLLVNDANTSDTHKVNPYLPSKYADYLGSGRPIWGVCEPGSQLSQRDLAYSSNLGDIDGARRVLELIAARTPIAGGAVETAATPA